MSDLNGNLTAFSVREVLELLAAGSKTGELRLRTDHGSGRILLADGHIAYATAATGADTVQELDRLLARYQPGGDDIGAGPRTIELALEEQVTDVLDEALDWDSGSFEFGTRNSAEDAAVHASSVDRVLELVEARRAEWKRLREVIPANDSVYSLSPRLPNGMAEATFDGLRWRLLALIGDGGSVDFIGRELEVSDYRAARLLADLIEAGYVQPDEDRVDPVGQPTVPVPEVYEQLAGGVDKDEHEPSVDVLELHEEPGDEVSESHEEPLGDDGFFDDEVVVEEPEPLPEVQPRQEPVTFSAGDLTQEEKDELIRNMGKGVFPT